MQSKAIVFIIALSALSVYGCPDERFCNGCLKNPDAELLCRSCEKSYFDPASKLCNPDVPSISNCFSYTLQGNSIVCSKCEYGFYYYSSKGQCAKCGVEKCAICSDYVSCQACFDGMMPTLDSFTQKVVCSKENKCPYAFCDICAGEFSTTHCEQCSYGYALDTTSQRCLKAPDNCKNFDAARPEYCVTCNWGYYIAADGSCKANYKTSILGIAILIFLVLGICGGIYYYYYKKWEMERQLTFFQRVKFSIFGSKPNNGTTKQMLIV
jgi:hypothetical protein